MASEERDFTKTPLVEKWSVKEVTDFIKTLPGLSELAPIFEENDIDGGMLFGLTDEELEKSLHIKSFGKRKKFLEEIRKRKRHSYLDEKRDELISSDLSTTTAGILDELYFLSINSALESIFH
jgi:hypothetical protein